MATFFENEGGYRVWYRTSSAGPYFDGGSTLNKTNTSYVVSGLNSDQRYYYRVRACTTSTCGKFSVANAGHRESESSTEDDEVMVIKNGVVPIPNLSNLGRWILILMTLGFGLFLVNRGRVRYLD